MSCRTVPKLACSCTSWFCFHGLGSGKGEVAVHAYRGKVVCRWEVCCLSLRLKFWQLIGSLVLQATVIMSKRTWAFADCGLYMCQPCRPVATCEWLVQRSFLQLTRICIKAIFFLSLSDTVVCGCSRTAMCAKFHGRAQSRVRFISWRGRQVAHETLPRTRRCSSLTMLHVRVFSESQ